MPLVEYVRKLKVEPKRWFFTFDGTPESIDELNARFGDDRAFWAAFVDGKTWALQNRSSGKEFHIYDISRKMMFEECQGGLTFFAGGNGAHIVGDPDPKLWAKVGERHSHAVRS